ncbi:MAG: Ig-like domain-containing protein [Treponema sp.]|nr:Ig-like domain-containing protein [Treponema sp.]
MENYSFINTYRKGVYFTNLLAAALIFIFSGCKNPSSESWEEPVRDYFEKYTNTAAIEKHEIDSEITKDKFGTICIPSDGDKTVTFYLRNPRNYDLDMTFNGPEGCVGPIQDTEDKSVVRITYPQSVLFENEAGGSIGGTITIKEHETQRNFDPYTFSLKCNTAPPSVTGQAVLVSSSNSQHYFVCFYLPTTELSEPSHSPDTHSIIIEGPNVQTFGPGTVTELTALSQSRPSDLAQITAGGSFSGTASGYTAFYYDTGRTMVEGENLSWNIYLRDSGGLTSRKMTASTIVRPANMTVSGETLLTTNDGETTAILTASVDDGTVSTWAWENSNDSIATVSNNNGTATITALSGGETTITIRANLTDGRIVNATKTVRVLDINIDASSPHDFIKGQADVALSTTKPDFATLSCQSGDEGIATVNASGQVTAVAKGSTTITASASYGGKTVSKTHTIYVHEVTISGGNEIFVNGSTLSLTANVDSPEGSGTLSGISYSWTSSATEKATIDTTGTVTAVAGGSTTITLNVTHNSQTTTVATQNIKVYQLSISGGTLYKKTSGTYTLSASLKSGITPYSGTDITYSWTSSTEATATINSTTGVMSTVSGGSTVITLYAKRGSTIVAYTTKKIYVVAVSGLTTFVKGEEPRALTATPASIEGCTFSWAIAPNSTYASANASNGKITATRKGSTTVRLTVQRNVSDYINIDTPINISELTISGLSSSNVTLAAGEILQYNYSFDPDISGSRTIKSLETNKAIIDSWSTSYISIKALAAGSADINLEETINGTKIVKKMLTVTVIDSRDVPINNLSTYLAGLAANDKDHPYKLNILNITPSNLSTLRTALKNNSTKYIDLSGTILPSGITSMEQAFYQCSNLVYAPSIPNSVQDMGACFSQCTNLKSCPSIPYGVKTMSSCFWGCSSIVSMPTIPASVTDMNSCFMYCSKLESAKTIPTSVTDISGIFSDCTSLSGTVTIQANITDSSKISGCFTNTNITQVTVPSTAMKNAFVYDTTSSTYCGIPASKVVANP